MQFLSKSSVRTEVWKCACVCVYVWHKIMLSLCQILLTILMTITTFWKGNMRFAVHWGEFIPTVMLDSKCKLWQNCKYKLFWIKTSFLKSFCSVFKEVSIVNALCWLPWEEQITNSKYLSFQSLFTSTIKLSRNYVPCTIKNVIR